MCSAPDMMLSCCISVHFLFQIYFVAMSRPDAIIMPGRRKRSRGPLTRKFVCSGRRDRVRRDLALLRGDAVVRVFVAAAATMMTMMTIRSEQSEAEQWREKRIERP